jgi:uncharacterized protein
MTGVTGEQFFGPTQAGERIELLDVIRGYALWGVLLINMMNFGALQVDLWTDPTNHFTYWAQRFFFEQKSWRLFSFMFGLSFAIQMIRAEDRGVRFVSVYTRRLAVLFGIGILHTFVYGSILVPYAWLGFVLMFFRKVSRRALLAWVVVLLMFWPVEQHVTRVWNRSHPPDPELATETRQRNAAEDWVGRDGGQARLRSRANGTLLEFLEANRQEGLFRRADILNWDEYRGSESNIGIFAMFLLGLYVGRRRIFQQIDRHRRFVRKVLWWGLGLGLAASLSDWIIRDFVCQVDAIWREDPCLNELHPAVTFGRAVVWSLGASAFSFFYAALIAVLFERPRWRRILVPLGAVGRTALTNYVLQTILFSLVFAGFGFGQQARLGSAPVFAIAVLIYAIEIPLSVWWLRHFRFGPLEWLWRTLTYMQLQPMRRPPAGALAAARS